MANKQHIFSGYGNPIDNNIEPDSESHHYLDTESGDLWLFGQYGWVCIYRAGSLGNIAFYNADTNPAPSDPDHPALRWFSDGLDVYINGEWREILLAPNT